MTIDFQMIPEWLNLGNHFLLLHKDDKERQEITKQFLSFYILNGGLLIYLVIRTTWRPNYHIWTKNSNQPPRDNFHPMRSNLIHTILLKNCGAMSLISSQLQINLIHSTKMNWQSLCISTSTSPRSVKSCICFPTFFSPNIQIT